MLPIPIEPTDPEGANFPARRANVSAARSATTDLWCEEDATAGRSRGGVCDVDRAENGDVLERASWPPPRRRRFVCCGLLSLSLLLSTTAEDAVDAFRFTPVPPEYLVLSFVIAGDWDGRGGSTARQYLSGRRSTTVEDARSCRPEEATECARGGGTCQSYKKKKRKQSYARTHNP